MSLAIDIPGDVGKQREHMGRFRDLAVVLLALAPACVGDDGDDDGGGGGGGTATTSQAVLARADSVVSMSLARAVAETYSTPRHVVSSSTAIDANGRVAMYGFNFREGGWVIVGADFQYVPILAENETGEIDLAEQHAPVVAWRSSTLELIGAIRDRSSADDATRQADIEDARELRDAWLGTLAKLGGRSDVDPAEVQRGTTQADLITCQVGDVCHPPPPQHCHVTSTETKEPLITTRWGQGCFYNKDLPADPQYAFGYCNRMPAGCSPVAAGQVLRYWNYNKPNPPWGLMTFDYATMPDTVKNYTGYGETQVQSLMFWLGLYAGTTYAHDGSATTNTHLRNALATMGFYTSYGSFTTPFATAYQQRVLGHPILVSGTDSSTNTAHIWVSDGTQQNIIDNLPCIATGSEKVKKLHYNWGWDGLFNGWFSETNFHGYSTNRHYIALAPQP